MKSLNLLALLVPGMILMSSCDKTDPHKTANPDYGTMKLVADWKNIEEGLEVPAYCTAWRKEAEKPVTTVLPTDKDTDTAPYLLLPPGECRVTIYSKSEKISFTDGYLAEVRPVTPIKPEVIDEMPGRLFVSVNNLQVKRDEIDTLKASMKQQVRKLTLVFNPSAIQYTSLGIIDETSQLSGVAAQWDCNTDTPAKPAIIKPRFVLTKHDTEDYNVFKTTVWLLGVVPTERQLLKLDILCGIPGDTQRTISIATDLTEVFSHTSFNQNKATPMQLNCDLLDFDGSISPWKQVNETGTGPIIIYPN